MKHDENKDVRLVSRIAKINYGDFSIKCSKTATIGIRTWGRIDFLTKYCGWHFIWDNNAGVSNFKADDNKESARTQKKAKKEPKLTDKTKKPKKK